MNTKRLVAAFVECPTAVSLGEGVVLEDFGQGMAYRGPAAVLEVLGAFFGGGFPDGRMGLQANLIDGNMAAVAFVFYGRQEHPFLGLPATGRAVEVPMIVLIRFARGAAEYLAWYYDAGTILRQLGLGLMKPKQ